MYRWTQPDWVVADPPDRPEDAFVSHHGLFISPLEPEKLFVGYASSSGQPFPAEQTPLFRGDGEGADFEFQPLDCKTQGASFVPAALDSVGRLILAVDDQLVRGGNLGAGPWGLIPGPTDADGIALHPIADVAIHPAAAFTFVVPAVNGVAVAWSLGTEWGLLKLEAE